MKHRVKEFMERIGTPADPNLTKEELIYSLVPFKRLLQEELDEFYEAIENNDVKEILDATVDLSYFLNQIIIKLEAVGIDYELACEKVCDNNDEKYSTSYNFIEAKLLEYVENDPWVGSKLYIDSSFVDGETYYCLKNEFGKVKKWLEFPKVNLEDCVPKEYL